MGLGKLDQQRRCTLVNSKHKRCLKVIEKAGGPTHYLTWNSLLPCRVKKLLKWSNNFFYDQKVASTFSLFSAKFYLQTKAQFFPYMKCHKMDYFMVKRLPIKQ